MGNKARYEFLKSHHICVNCGQNDAEPGITLCLVCKMDKRERDKNRQPRNRTDYYMLRREQCNADGICIVCCKRKATDGHTTCAWCRAQARNRATKNRLEAGVTPREIFWDGHHCAICGTENILPGKKTCEVCYQKMRNNMLYARKLRKSVNYFERLQKRVCIDGKV